MNSIRACIVVSSVDILMRGVCGLDKIAMQHLVQIICMVIIWVIVFQLEQVCDHLSHFRVVCDHVFVGFCIGSNLYCERNGAW